MNNLLLRRLFPCVVVSFAILASSCASTDSVPSKEEIQIGKLLDDIRDGAEPGEVKSCLSTYSYDNVEIVNDRRLIFFARGKGAWLNELRRPCAGLRRNDALVFDLRGSSVCSLDSVSAVERIGGTPRTGSVCTLGKFIEIPDWQVERVEQFLGEL